MTAATKTAAPVVRTVYDFLQEHGRLPQLGDPEPPWTYKGWALPYVQMIDRIAGPCRWEYHLSTLHAGHLLSGPIPPLHFGTPDPKVASMLDRWTRIIGWDMGGWHECREEQED